MAKYVLKPGSHSTWYVNTSGDTWVVNKSIRFQVYNGDGISDSATQHNSHIFVYGQITALDGEGVDLYGRNNNVYVGTSGLIKTAHGFGIAFEGTAYNGSVENHGRITSDFGGVSMTGSTPQSSRANVAEVDNYGTISGGSYGVDSRSDDLKVINRHGALISGGQYAIGSVENDVTVLNAGTIKGGAQGAILLNSGNDHVINSGKIIGNVTLNNGNDIFTNRGGTVQGIINLGTGADTYIVDRTSLKLHEDDFSDIDTVKSSVSWTLGDNFENLTLTGTARINARGNAENNVLRGNGQNNTLTGFAGDDRLHGGGGADRFVFATGSGHDTIDDFTHGKDRIDLRGYAGIDHFSDIVSISGKHDAVITLSQNGADTITLTGVSASHVHASDFLFG